MFWGQELISEFCADCIPPLILKNTCRNLISFLICVRFSITYQQNETLKGSLEPGRKRKQKKTYNLALNTANFLNCLGSVFIFPTLPKFYTHSHFLNFKGMRYELNFDMQSFNTKEKMTNKGSFEIGNFRLLLKHWFVLVWFYDITTIVDYLMPNSLYSYILNIYDLAGLDFMAFQLLLVI